MSFSSSVKHEQAVFRLDGASFGKEYGNLMKKRQQYQYAMAFALDALSLFVSCFIAWLIFDVLFYRLLPYSFADRVEFFELLTVSFIISFFCFDQSQNILRRTWTRELRQSALFNLVTMAGLVILATIAKAKMLDSRYMVFGIPIINTPVMTLFHQGLKRFLRKPGALGKMQDLVGVITTSDKAEYLIQDIQRDWTKKVVGVALLDEIIADGSYAGVPVKAVYQDCLEWIRHESLDEVYLQVPMDSGQSLLPVLRELESMGTTLYVFLSQLDMVEKDPQYNDLPARLGDQIEYCAGSPVISLKTTRMDPVGTAAKRILDLAGGIVGSLIAIPIIALVAIPQQLESPGPILFKQKRVGLNGRIFEMYKIRSMYMDAEERKKELMAKNEMNGLMFKIADDPRITKVGKFIRKTSLDEFPQFFNVLKGEMSLVGTRPPTLDEYEQYQSHHKRRLSMKPGITGLWQVSGRSDMQDFEEIVKLDCSYIDQWTFWTDIKILFRTVMVVLTHKGAE